MRTHPVGRVREGTPSERVQVFAQRHGEEAPTLLGEVVIEDLGNVLTRIVTRKGANGPQGPVTQFILAAAAEQLLTRLANDFRAPGDLESVPRILSALIGHEPFVEDTLGLSVNQMRRRWPTAADWYGDLVAYVLRPQRHEQNMAEVLTSLPEWETGTFGEVMAAIAEHQLKASQRPELYRLADTIRTLWPTHDAVRTAQRTELATLRQRWVPVLTDLLRRYRLALRPGVDPGDLVWMTNALVSTEAQQRLVDPAGVQPAADSAEQGRGGSRSAWAMMATLAGTVVDDRGRALDLDQLHERRPVAADDSRGS